MKTLVKKTLGMVGIHTRTDLLVVAAIGMGIVLMMMGLAYGLEQSDTVYRNTMGL